MPLSLHTAPANAPSASAAKPTAPGIAVTVEQTDASAATDGERKTVTALFADIKGSTELIRELDPEDARAIVDPVLNLMMEAVHRYGGYVAQSTGDGIFALFGAPIAHEDHPQRALHAALAMQEELRHDAERLKSQGRPPVEVRVGVNTGEVVVRTIQTGGPHRVHAGRSYDQSGGAHADRSAGGLHRDQRRDTAAGEDYFHFHAWGRTEVKGLSEPINVYEVLGAGPLRGHFELAARRGLTKFVGRDA